MNAWRAQNRRLQCEYNRYRFPKNSKEKDKAALQIQKILEWPPFADYVSKNPMASPYGIVKYGIDYGTEKCISEIDKIARNEMNI